MPLITTPGQHLKHCRLEARMTRMDVALRIETAPRVAAIQRMALLSLIEADLLPVRMTTAATLSAIPELRISPTVLAAIVDAFEDHMSGTPTIRFSPAQTLNETKRG